MKTISTNTCIARTVEVTSLTIFNITQNTSIVVKLVEVFADLAVVDCITSETVGDIARHTSVIENGIVSQTGITDII